MDNIRPIDANKFEVIGGIIPDGYDVDSYLAGCKEILDMIDNAPTLEYPKWISVKERLPEIDAEVLIYTDEGLYDVAQYSGGERFWTLERNPDCWVTASGVTHWMPLPEPMKEG